MDERSAEYAIATGVTTGLWAAAVRVATGDTDATTGESTVDELHH